MRRAPTAAFVWAFAGYSYGATTVSAAWFGRRFMAARGEALSMADSLLWQGAIYAAWLPAAAIVWAVLRRFGSGARGLAALLLAGVAVMPLEALTATLIDSRFVGAGDITERLLGRLPVCILLYTAIVAVGLAAVHHRRAAQARARTAILETALAEARQALPPALPPERLMVMTGSRRVPVAVDAVEWFSAADNYVVVHWASGEGAGREGLLRATLQSLEARLDPKVFARSHRSALVNLARVRQAQPLSDGSWRLVLESGAEVVTSRTYRDDLLKRLGR